MNNSENKVTILVCNSNLFIPYVLTEILSNQKRDYLVISDIDNIELFFNNMQFKNVIFFKYGTNYKLLDIIRSKRDIMSLTKKYKIEKLIFFHSEFGELANWFINKIAKEIPIFYCNIYPRPSLPSACFKKKMKGKIKQYIYWRINMDILSTGNNVCPVLPLRFFQKNNIQEFKIEISPLLIRSKLSSLLSKININVPGVLLTGTVVKCKYVDEFEYTKQINSIIEYIGEENIASKCHPRFSSLYGKENKLEQIPNYIPGNLIIDSYDFFIGYESTLLVEASKAGKVSISLLEYFKPISNEVKQNRRKFIDDRLEKNNIIYYPKNIQELSTIFTKHKLLTK